MATTKVTTGGITDATIATADIADDAVTNAKIAAGAVGGTQLGSNAVTAAKIGSSEVTAAAIAASAVGTAKIADNAVTSAKLASDSVTSAKIVDQAVTLNKLPHGTSSNDGKFLRANNGADPTFESLPASGVTVSNNSNNRITTGDGTNLVAETNFQFNPDSGGDSLVTVIAPEGGDAKIQLNADENDDLYDRWEIKSGADNHFTINQMSGGGAFQPQVKIYSNTRGVIEPTHDPMGLFGAGIIVAIAQSNQGDQNDSPNFKVDFTVPIGMMSNTKRDDADYGASSGQTRMNASSKSFGGSGILIASCHGNYYWGHQTKIYHISTTGNGSSFHTRLDQLHSYSYAGHGSNSSSISLSAQSHTNFTPTIRATFGGDYWSSNLLQVTYIGSGAASYANLGGLTHLHSSLTGQDLSWK